MAMENACMCPKRVVQDWGNSRVRACMTTYFYSVLLTSAWSHVLAFLRGVMPGVVLGVSAPSPLAMSHLLRLAAGKDTEYRTTINAKYIIQIANSDLCDGTRFHTRWKIDVLLKEARPSWKECWSLAKCEILYHCTNQYHSLFVLYNTSNVNKIE